MENLGPVGAPRLVDVITGLQRRLARSVDSALTEVDLTLDQWRALRALDEGPGVTMGGLTERLQTPPPSTTRLVDALVDRALVYRCPSDVDRRRIEIALSEAGHRLLVQADDVVRGHEERVRGSMTVELWQLADTLGASASC